jgi:hypothetical protein
MSDTVIYILPLVVVVGLSAFFYSLKNYVYLLIFHLVLRAIFDSASSITYQPIGGGIRVGQAFSFFYILVFTLYILKDKVRWQLNSLLPVFAIIFISMIGTVFSGYWAGFAIFFVKWIYFSLLFMVGYVIAIHYDDKKIAVMLFIGSFYPILNQLFVGSVLGPKCVINQPVCSYIGTFYHESELSSWILMFLLATAIGVKSSAGFARMFYFGMFFVGLFSLFLNGYRTSILGFLAFLGVIYWVYIKAINAAFSIISIALIITGVLSVLYFSYDSIEAYVDDVVILLENPGKYFSLTEQIERNTLFSGRLYLFNRILLLWVSTGVPEYFFGIGPEVIMKEAGIFAHNEFISALVELGIFGFMALIWFLVTGFRTVFRSKDEILLGMYLCILVTALATMPFHDTRGIILLALVMGLARGKQLRRKRLSNKTKLKPKP